MVAKVIEKELNEIIEVMKEDGNWNYSPYMLGLLNGLLLAESIMKRNKKDPEYYTEPEKWYEEQRYEKPMVSAMKDLGDATKGLTAGWKWT